jgi:hypothetical protein
MKKALIVILVGIFFIGTFSSCKKDDDFGYSQVPEENTDTIHWEDEYSDGGTLPNGTGWVNDLVGTKWVLTKYVSGFATQYPNDTIHFVTQNNYTLNGGAVRTYQLSNVPSSTNKDLQLNFFFPFGGSHYAGQVGEFFVTDGVMNNIEFEDIQNPSTSIRAWLIKL